MTNIREPVCVHSGGEMRTQQPASACRICKDSPELRTWREGWAAWFAEHPDDPRRTIGELR